MIREVDTKSAGLHGSCTAVFLVFFIRVSASTVGACIPFLPPVHGFKTPKVYEGKGLKNVHKSPTL